MRTVAAVLDVRLGVVARWRGGDLDRMLAAGHAALHESVARFFATLPDWEIAPEVSFSIYGERGVIDILAWHAASRTLLVIELKTEIVDVHALMATTDRYVRLAPKVAADRGWRPARVARWVIVSDTTSNRDRAREHAAVLAAAFPCNGRQIHAWLRSPDQIVSGLSFWSNSNASGVMEVASTRKRVRARRSPGAGA